MVKIEDYPVSPYASMDSKNVGKYLYVPIEYVGRITVDEILTIII